MTNIIFLIVFFNEVITAVNVASYKKANYCGSTENVIESVTDGDKAITNAQEIHNPCANNSYIEIDLEETFYINYVVVYEGEFRESKVLDYFKVFIDDKLCGHYPKRSIGPILNKGMRVNCKVFESSRKVKIESLYNIGFSITEIEVYSIVSDYEGRAVLIHLGCFKIFEGGESVVDNLTNCNEKCQNISQHYASFKLPNKCFCGAVLRVSSRLTLEKCDIKCGDNYCGGVNAFSVYLARIELPSFESCYSGSIMIYSYLKINIYECFKKCEGIPYVALKKGKECACITSLLDLVIVNNSYCNVPCNNNPDEICGGENHLSVYRKQNMKLLQCETEMDQYGVCKDGCKPYYIGEYCFEYIIQYCHNFNPCVEIPNTKCSLSRTTDYQCECMDGFKASNASMHCTDIDECNTDPCNKLFSTCTNWPGGYECTCHPSVDPNMMEIVCVPQHATRTSYTSENTSESLTTVNLCDSLDPCTNKSNTECVIFSSSTYRCECIEGYTEISEVCKDIDECEYDPCDEKSSTCYNMEGAYRCDCFESFVQVTEFVCITNGSYSSYSTKTFGVTFLFVIPLIVFIFMTFALIWTWRPIKQSSSSSTPSIEL